MSKRRRLLLLILMATASVYVGSVAFDDKTAVSIFKYGGYWTIGATVILFFDSIWRTYGCSLPDLGSYFRSNCGRIGLVTMLLGAVFLLRAEPWDFKTIMDEHVLAITAKRMHETREVEATTRSMSINGAPTPLRGYVDKRPILQPYFVSVINDVTGYRPRNGVYLNIFLTPFILLLLYVIAVRVGGIWTGVATVALFCTLPILSYMCAGGGLEPLNVFFILLTWLLGGLYLDKPDAGRLGAFLFSGVLLAQCRYESILFVLPVGLVVLWSWFKDRQVSVPWQLIICPVLLIPYLWQHRVFGASTYMWQMADVTDADEPFGLQYMYDNLGRAVGFFFDFTYKIPNSWLLVAVGAIALLLLFVVGLRHIREFSSLDSFTQVGVMFMPGFALLFLLLLGYGWEFDNPVIRRLSLPLHIPLALAGAYLLFHVIQSRKIHLLATGVIAVYYMAYAFPITTQRYYSRIYTPGQEFQLAEKFLDQHPDERMVVIADNAGFFILFGKDSLSTAFANLRKKAIKFYIQQPNSAPVYYFRRLVYNPVTGDYAASSRGHLSDDFVLEPIWEEAFTEMRKVQFARVVDVKGVELEEIEFENPGDYLQHWARNLP